ncbi:hypothetical protein CYMTET_40780 [Cymbomonas tetramitiformis]|uniref:Uncharacterized protein n=1 Tax=Cymbomonas tetramitiformis TaxID=36881 RepID=A0AAE0C9F2_9CHLO|nr:hypothetical protein CYMTET_40780 [Cymbomonas tetramitiformis]
MGFNVHSDNHTSFLVSVRARIILLTLFVGLQFSWCQDMRNLASTSSPSTPPTTSFSPTTAPITQDQVNAQINSVLLDYTVKLANAFQSCTAACTAVGAQCVQSTFRSLLAALNPQDQTYKTLFSTAGETCGGLSYQYNGEDHPVWVQNDLCYVPSDATNAQLTCDGSPTVHSSGNDKRRLCFCTHLTTGAPTQAPNAVCWSQGAVSDLNTSSSRLEYQHNSFLDRLNAEFTLTASATPTSAEYPNSLLPVLFTRNPVTGDTKGLSLGSGTSDQYMTLRMGNSTHFISHNFGYQTTIQTGTLLWFQLTCGFQQGSAGERWRHIQPRWRVVRRLLGMALRGRSRLSFCLSPRDIHSHYDCNPHNYTPSNRSAQYRAPHNKLSNRSNHLSDNLNPFCISNDNLTHILAFHSCPHRPAKYGVAHRKPNHGLSHIRNAHQQPKFLHPYYDSHHAGTHLTNSDCPTHSISFYQLTHSVANNQYANHLGSFHELPLSATNAEPFRSSYCFPDYTVTNNATHNCPDYSLPHRPASSSPSTTPFSTTLLHHRRR